MICVSPLCLNLVYPWWTLNRPTNGPEGSLYGDNTWAYIIKHKEGQTYRTIVSVNTTRS